LDTKTFINQYFKVYEKGEVELIKEFLHDQHIYYPPAGSAPQNLAQRIEEDRLFLSAFTKIEVEISDQIAEGSKVASRIIMNATHTGTFHGIEASGKCIRITFMDFVNIYQDKIIREWTEFDIQNILSQIT
jgi:steroid delta-isomerase-like uncharacterized protein